MSGFRTAPPHHRRVSAWLITLAAVVCAIVAAGASPQRSAAAGATLQTWLTTADGTNALTQQSNITLGPASRGGVNVSVDDSHSYQTMSGLGAAFTDSSTLLMKQLKDYSSSSYNTLMNDLFNTSTGLGLAFWRIPMTASDFNSTSTPWTDDDTQGPPNNPTQYFGLTAQDTGHVIPVIKDALAINSNIELFGSPWSPPAWMKSNGSMICNTGSGNASLNTSDYQPWADYFVKWVNTFQGQGVPIWGLTPQNEPLYCPNNYPGSSWDAASEANWVHNYLKPDLSSNSLSPTLLGFDHNWDSLSFPQSLDTSSAAGDFSGMAWHCYDYNSDPTMMSAIHNQYGGDQYETECSSDTNPTDIIPYTTAEMALLSIQNWAKGVDLWNVALNSQNGPHLGGCSSCVPMVTIDTTVDGSGHVTSASYTLDNNYYQFGQISKFVPVGSTHIASTVNAHGVITAAFKRPDGQEVLVATNTNSSSSTFTVSWNSQGSFSYTLPAKATVTFTGTVAAAPVQSSTPTVGTVYKIVNRLTGKPFGVSGASLANSAPIVQWTDDGDPDQAWLLQSAGSGYYNVINANSLDALDNTGSTSTGTQMQQYAISGTGNSNQQWSLTSAGGGYYTITNRTSGMVLDLTGGGIGDNTAIQQWTAYSGDLNQQWQFVPVGTTAPTAGHVYKLVSAATGKPTGINGGSTADGAGVIEYTNNGNLDQQWGIQGADSGYFNLIDANSGKALDDTGGSTSNGTQMQQYSIGGTGNSNQQWQFAAVGDGTYTVTNRTSSLNLDLTGGSSADGTPIQQWSPATGDVNQHWQFIPLN